METFKNKIVNLLEKVFEVVVYVVEYAAYLVRLGSYNLDQILVKYNVLEKVNVFIAFIAKLLTSLKLSLSKADTNLRKYPVYVKIAAVIVFGAKYVVYLLKLLYWKVRDLFRKFPVWAPVISFALFLAIVIAGHFITPIIQRNAAGNAPQPLALTRAPANTGYSFQAKDPKNKFAGLIGDSKTNAPKIEADFGTTSKVDFTLTGLNPNLTPPTQSGNSVTFKEVRKNVDLTYKTLSNGLKESLTVKVPSKGNAFTFNLNTKNASPVQFAQDTYSPVFYDSSGKFLFHFEQPFAIDAKGARTNNAIISIHGAKGTSYTATVIVDQKWLSDPARVYPITIDPTLTYNLSSSFSGGTFNRSSDTGNVTPMTSATGGTITTSGGYTIHTFTSNGTFTPNGSGNVDVLVVAGGGGGGSSQSGQGGAGGGGGGGLIYNAAYSVSGPVSITVGGGGAGGAIGPPGVRGANGSNSTFGTLIAVGGGGGGSGCGGCGVSTGLNGGSGGGAGYQSYNLSTPGSGTSGQGNAGGNNGATSGAGGGAGGGAGTVGQAPTNSPIHNGGVGGTGLAYSISGASTYYAGGGAGGSGNGMVSGGQGGGGSSDGTGQNGTTNTGGGGGGSYSSTAKGGDGGSGIVIVRYPTGGSGSTPNLTTYYQETPADQNTVGLWHMNEASGNALDSSGNNITGTSTGTSVVTGILGNARSFGSGKYLTMTDSKLNLSDSSPLTIETWVYLTGTSSYILDKGQATGSSFRYELMMSGNTPVFTLAKQSVVAISATSNATCVNNTWCSIIATYDGTTNANSMKLYVNGMLTGTATYNQTGATGSSGNLIIGSGYDLSSTFNGYIDEVRISNVARAPEEVRLYAQRRPYSVYTSPVIDLGSGNNSPLTWSPLVWTELGVGTGDGETLSNSANLVAQWNFNETSGITANNTITNPAGLGTGGTITVSGGYAIHTFTSSGTFTPNASGNVDYLVVAGGGSGGSSGSGGGNVGGGGAGGLLTGTLAVTSGTPISVTVGNGGAATSGAANGNPGNNSVLGSITAHGGGYGATSSGTGGNGGSGGGKGDGGAGTFGSGTGGEGYNGGTSTTHGGGGGGAGGVGGSQPGAQGGGGNGGSGTSSSLSGSAVTYAGGGGGGYGGTGTGGGGTGGMSTNGVDGTANTGGGGGGASGSSKNGGAGGSGVVIVRYPYAGSLPTGCGSSCNGTLTNFASTTSQDQAAGTGWTATNGKWPKTTPAALMFDGVDDWVSVPSNAALNFGANDFSVEWWENRRNNLSYNPVIARDNTTYTPYLIGHNDGGGKITVYMSSNGSSWDIANDQSMGTTIVGQWTYYTLTRSGSTFTTYQNGIKQSTWQSSTAIPSSASPLQIGKYATSYFYSGILDSLRVYSRALTASEILSNYNSGNLEIQTRVGNTIDPNSGSWDAWLPITSEASIDNMDTANSSATIDFSQGADKLITKKSLATVSTGTGADGACTVTGTTNINTGSCAGRGTADGAYFSSTVLTSAGATSITLSGTPTGLTAGDEVMIINEQGTSTNNKNVGLYETHTIASISTNTLNFTDSTIKNTYDGTTQKITVQRIPNYTNVTIGRAASGATGADNTHAGYSCLDLKNSGVNADGTYWIDPDGPGGNAPFQAVCNMTRDGGGWTEVLKDWYTSGASGNTGALGAIADASTVKTNPYKISDANIRTIIGPSNNFDVMGDQTGYNASYSTGNYEYVILRNYTAYWRFDIPMTPSMSETQFQSYRISDNALAGTFNLMCGHAGAAGINCYDVIYNNPAGGAGCNINMGSSADPSYHRFQMSDYNTDTYLYDCNGAQYSSSQSFAHRFWIREKQPAVLTAAAWDGTKGGIVAFRANGTVTINNGVISTAGLGYRGGASTGALWNTGRSFGGEAIGGTGVNCTGAVACSTTTTLPTNLGSQGTIIANGGTGGSNGTAGQTGLYDNASYIYPGTPGIITGEPTLTQRMTLGGGGSGGGDGDDNVIGWGRTNAANGLGGTGGGITFIAANTLTTGSTGRIDANGAGGASGWTYTAGSWIAGGSGGGGAGGSLNISGNTLALNNNLVTAKGGISGHTFAGTYGSGWVNFTDGGAGGAGRISILYNTSLSGNSVPSATISKPLPATLDYMEGTGGLHLQTGNQQAGGTVGLWHFGQNTSTKTFVYTGADQTYTVPAGVTSITTKLWGGGGGGGNLGGWTYGFPGGGGGYTSGILSVTPGQSITVVVGAGGNAGTTSVKTSSYGGGGQNCAAAGTDCQYAGQGGGRSAVKGPTTTFSATGGTVTTVTEPSNQAMGGVVTSITEPSNQAMGGVITYTDSNGLNPRSTPYSGGFTVHTFLSGGTFTPKASGNVDYLVVGGGGGGGGAPSSNIGGGGGSGGLLSGTDSLTVGSYTINVGSGGARGAASASGGAGGNSVFNAHTAIGGGYGAGAANGVATAGGSGGGGGGGFSTGAGGSGTGGQAYTGAAGPGGGAGGGGGGAGGAPSTSIGGIGSSSSISGTAVTYAAGGYGNGRDGNGTAAPAATANTGNGGDGGWNNTGGAGGSGIVIIRYPTSSQTTTYTVHTFASGGTFTPRVAGNVQVLVVGGGGGGGGAGAGAGGGGGGGVIYNSSYAVTTSPIVVTVGNGGDGVTTSTYVSTIDNGSDSIFGTLDAVGGGGGSSGNVTGGNGGSGGGGGGGYTTNGGNGTTGQGYAGGKGIYTNPNYAAGGGGGAGGVGVSPVAGTAGGNGGNGTAYSISGSSLYYGGGGGGGTYTSTGSTAGTGGSGGGGNAGNGNNANGSNGTANTGGGGGGGGGYSATSTGGNGGSGIVIVSYPTSGSTVSYTVHTFTSNGTFTGTGGAGNVEVLVVGGGGGGGGAGAGAGGGGGGGVIYNSSYPVSSQVPVTIGGGGTGVSTSAYTTTINNGSDSIFGTLDAVGGGGGSSGNIVGGTGGSGGGGDGGYLTNGGSPTSGQGYAGGKGYGTGNYAGGGGGGGGAVGITPIFSTAGGNGGLGAAYSISGTSTFYAGGGGGGTYLVSGATGGTGASGGGNGGAGESANGTNGTVNTGGGGGGGGGYTAVTHGGNGGSGIVIVRYPTGQTSVGDLLTAGGGGGGGSHSGSVSNMSGGAGGGSSGQAGWADDLATAWGGGGTQSAGGAGATATYTGSAGFSYQGGSPNTNSYGGGGGGGWNGGGGGGYASNSMGGGGGGSGYIGGTGVSSATTTAGSAWIPGNSTDLDNGYSGYGGLGGNATPPVTAGTPGKVVITAGAPPSNADELDASGNGNNAQVGNTTLVNGITGRGRSFGATDYITTPLNNWNPSAATIEMWVKPTWSGGDSAGHGLWQNFNNTLIDKANMVSIFKYANNQLFLRVTDSAGTNHDCSPAASTYFTAGQWTHVAATYSASGSYLYINGIQVCTLAAFALPTIPVDNAGRIGYAYQYPFNGGVIDEVRVSSVARSAEEIAEDYRLGANQYINKTFTNADLTSAQSLQFQVAADRPGTYLAATIGNSAYANYQPDDNTVGLWHLDDNGTGITVRDSSNTGARGTVTGTTYVQGKIGGARSFASGDRINIPTNASLNLANNFTIDGWVKLGAAGVQHNIASKYQNDNTGWVLFRYADNKFYLQGGNGTSWPGAFNCVTTGTWTDSNWHHVAAVVGTSVSIYVDGQAVLSGCTRSGDVASNNADFVIGGWSTTGSYVGTIDEVRYSNTARSAADIRAAYEAGARSHQITIDFAANLDSTGLIANSGATSFVIDATKYGLSSKGANLYPGDKIVVYENSNNVVYTAQGTVNSVTASSGTVTVAAWDSGSTFPSGGYTANANVFKWQKEYMDLSSIPNAQKNTVNTLSLRITNGNEGRTIWVDDIRSAGQYLSTPAGINPASALGKQYFQYRVIETSSDYNVSPSITSVVLSYKNRLPEAPTIGTATGLSSSSIQWGFGVAAEGGDPVNHPIIGYKLFDGSGNDLSGANVTCTTSSCTETGLSPSVQYTRKVIAYNDLGNGPFSGTASAYTLAVVPSPKADGSGATTTDQGTATTVRLTPGAGNNGATTQIAIYMTTGTTCPTPGAESGGNFLKLDGTSNGATAVWDTVGSGHWAQVTLTGLNLDTNGYLFCTKARNGDHVETNYWAESSNGGWLPISGNFTVTTNITYANAYLDGADVTKTVAGLDLGSGTQNTSIMTVKSGVLTVQPKQTIAAGSFVLTGGSIALPANGTGQLKVGSPLWVVDADHDGYVTGSGGAPKLYYGTQPANSARKNTLSSMSIADCNDGPGTNANLVFLAHAQCYTDADGDTYTSGATANSTCLNTTSCATATARSASTDGATVTTGLTVGRMANAATTLDCYDNSLNAYPGSTYCSTASRGDGSYDYNCRGGSGVACGNIDNVTGGNQGNMCWNNCGGSHGQTCQAHCYYYYPYTTTTACGQGGYYCTNTLSGYTGCEASTCNLVGYTTFCGGNAYSVQSCN